MKNLKAIFDSPWPLLISLALATLVALATSIDWVYSQPKYQAPPPIEPAPVSERARP
jgi:hypothetical protein